MNRSLAFATIVALLSLLQACAEKDPPAAPPLQQGVARAERHLAPALRTAPPTAPDSHSADAAR